MKDEWSDLRRVASTSGVYAVGTLAQRGLAFILLPIYTRYIDPAQYGILELLNSFTSIVFLFLLLGLDSAINKAFHRDCRSPAEQLQVLPTAIVLSTPVVLAGSILIVLLAEPIGNLLLGGAASKDLIYLSMIHGFLSGIAGLFFASLRAREAARAFALVSFLQLGIAMLLNIMLVVKFGMGIRGILWGNLISYLVALPLSAVAARKGFTVSFRSELVRPMLTFGILLIPASLADWVVNLSDRYLLRLFKDLSEVAVYSVGYKIGMLIQLVIVWPFQLAWPAVSFSISNREGYQKTYARMLTYIVALLVYSVIGLSLLSDLAIPGLLDPSYHEANRVVPLIAVAYAFNGVYFCVSPGILVAGYARYMGLFSGAAALVNILLNLALIPAWGMMGAAVATILAFATLALLTARFGQRVHPVPYESLRLKKAVLVGLALFAIAELTRPASFVASIVWFALLGVIAYPLLLILVQFFDEEERATFAGVLIKTRKWLSRKNRDH